MIYNYSNSERKQLAILDLQYKVKEYSSKRIKSVKSILTNIVKTYNIGI